MGGCSVQRHAFNAAAVGGDQLAQEPSFLVIFRVGALL